MVKIGFHESDASEAETQHNAWETIQRSHAIANGVYVAAVNRVGIEGDGLRFWGGSFVADPQGCMLARAGEGEETLIAECDPRVIEHVRRSWPLGGELRLQWKTKRALVVITGRAAREASRPRLPVWRRS